MISKIIIHAASIVVQNKKDRVQVLGSGAVDSLKSKLPAILLNESAARFERRSKTTQSNCTQSYAAHFW